MIDERIIEMLESPDAETRKAGIKALAKSKSRDALPYLAEMYREDFDEEVRDLARKAGQYIKKQLDEEGAVSTPVTRSAPAPARSSMGSLYDEEDDDEDEEEDLPPLPSQIHVTPAQEQQAKGLVEQALDRHMRGDNEKALQYLTRALKTNPRLVTDSYTISLAATLTGEDGREVLRRLAPDAKSLRSRQAGGAAQRSNTSQAIIAYLVMMGAVVVLVGYFLLSWVDFSKVPVEGDTGPTTFGEAMENMSAMMGLVSVSGSPEAQRLIDAFQSIKVTFNGLEVTTLSLGIQDVADVMGFTNVTRVLAQMLGGSAAEADAAVAQMKADLPPVEVAPLDLTYPFIPIVALAAAVMGLVLLRRSSLRLWGLCVLAGLLGIIPLAYFYTDAVDTILSGDIVSLGEIGAFSGTDFIGIGFWVTLGGMLMVLLLPFIAMLLTPAPEQES